VLPGNIFQRPILLARQFSVPSKLYNPSPSCLGDRLSAVCAARINHHDLLRERYATRQSTQVRRSFLTGTSTDNGTPRVGTARSLTVLALPAFARWISDDDCFEVLRPSSQLLVHQQLLPRHCDTWGLTNASAQIHTSEPITIGGRSSGKSGLVRSCVPGKDARDARP